MESIMLVFFVIFVTYLTQSVIRIFIKEGKPTGPFEISATVFNVLGLAMFWFLIINELIERVVI